MKLTIAKRVLYFFMLPLLVEFAAVVLISSTDSGAYAEGFASLALLVMLIIAIPLTIIGNLFIMPRLAEIGSNQLWRGMIIPALFIGICLVYYTGIWDKTIDPLLPRSVEMIQPAGSGWVNDTTYEIFLTLHGDYSSELQRQTISENARNRLIASHVEPSYASNVTTFLYVVPAEDYAPLDHASSRAMAVAFYSYSGGENLVEKWLR